MKQLTPEIKKRILKSLGDPALKEQKKLKRGNFKYEVTWFGNNGWCIKVSHRAYYKVRGLLITRGLVIDVIPSNYGVISGLYPLREIAH